MKQHISFKIILPLLVIFILTLVVNMTVISTLQSARQVLNTIADEGSSMEIAQTQQLAKDMSNEISSTLARDGVISTTQLLMVVITIIIAVLCITNPLKKIIEQLNQLTDNLENNQGNLEERIETKKTDEIGKMVSGINLYMDKLQLIMKMV